MTAQAGKWRKRPVEVEAIRWDGGAAAAGPVIDWVLAGGGTAHYYADGELADAEPGKHVGERIAIRTLEGDILASPGDWVIRGVQGEHYPCKPDIFAETYESAADPRIAAGLAVMAGTPWYSLDKYATPTRTAWLERLLAAMDPVDPARHRG